MNTPTIFDSIKSELPIDYVTDELREARVLLSEAQRSLDDAIAAASKLVPEYDRAVEAAGLARRNYGANPVKKLADKLHASEREVNELAARHESAEEAISEAKVELDEVKAYHDRTEADALAAYRAAEKAKKEAAAKAFEQQITDLVQSTPADVRAMVKIDATTKEALLACLGMPERFWSLAGRAA